MCKSTKNREALFHWSGGKDSSLALYHVLEESHFQVNSLVTTINEKFQRVSMHGLRKDLLLKQAKSLKLPIQCIELPEDIGMADYENLMNQHLINDQNKTTKHHIFGDIFLEDLRDYREKQFNKIGFHLSFPLWKQNTVDLAREFIDLGFKAIVVCINSQLLSKEFAGRMFDDSFLQDLPKGVDPCGENGEFHTFVFDGPIFEHAVDFEIGEVVFRSYKFKETSDDECFMDQPAPDKSGFWFCDLL
jgi:uncharacterized protein (TIGR00290 family)